MANLRNHRGKWLRNDAADAFDRAEAAHGVFVVNSAGRTVAEQQNLINRWNQGGVWNRPPYLYRPAMPAESSNHVSDGGIAVDIGDWRRFAAICQDFGFAHTYPDGDPVHFDFVGLGEPLVRTETTRNRQNWLNTQGWDLVEDGYEGALTKKAYSEYQRLLTRHGFYQGEIDGEWGPMTEAGHKRYWSKVNSAGTAKPKPPAPKPPAPRPVRAANVGDLASIGDVRGMQKIARRYGYKGKIDNEWGPGSRTGFQNFLVRNYKGSLANWLRSRWGYKGNDVWGPVMTAAAQRANAENFRVL